jgi:hormone-sensitive lipase
LRSFHGGGFISMSAFSHENYTRAWAIKLGIPVVSVDYSLAPQAPFPQAVNEAFAAYQWCRERLCKAWGCDKIILAGDSAGGNLIATVAIQCIQRGVQPPHGLLLIYPALDIRPSFSPSMLRTINDPMIPYLFLQCCMGAYLGSSDFEELTRICQNPLASPNSASDDVVARFPRCHFVAAELDPLFDQTVTFADRLARLAPPGAVKVSLVPVMVHGFLSFHWPVIGVKEVRKLIAECATYVDALIAAPPLHPLPLP